MLSFLNPAETDQHYFEKGLFWTSLEIQTSVNGGKYQSRRGKLYLNSVQQLPLIPFPGLPPYASRPPRALLYSSACLIIVW